jgi:DnaJ-class molecular chaperone
MGFDLHGKFPSGKAPKVVKDWKDRKSVEQYFEWEKKTKGAYFRNSCWGWRPLWHFVCNTCMDILPVNAFEKGNYNDGYEISKDMATRIGLRLEHLINQGSVKLYEQTYKDTMDRIPDETCSICNGKGVREYRVCVSCKGSGKRRPSETFYLLDEENVKEFAEFCLKSGGFTID